MTIGRCPRKDVPQAGIGLLWDCALATPVRDAYIVAMFFLK